MSEEGDSSEQAVGNDDDLIETNKTKHKIIRVLTVIAYALSVSMAAILLSIYYVFMWDGHPTLARKDPSHSPHNHPLAQHQQQTPPPAAYTLSTSGTSRMTTTESKELLMRGHTFENLAVANKFDENTEENVLVDVPYEPTAIPVVEAKTEAPSPSTPEPIIEETLNEGDWPINISYSQLPELTKRSPMFKKLILSNIMD